MLIIDFTTTFWLSYFAGSSKWAIVPPFGKTGNDQRETRVSVFITTKILSPLETFLKWQPLKSLPKLSPSTCRFQKDPTWSETGDRYLLKLFRDHLFHQVTETGTPWIDLSHIVSCLNKVSLCIGAHVISGSMTSYHCIESYIKNAIYTRHDFNTPLNI